MGGLIVMGDADIDFSARRRELEGIGKEIHNHFVEVAAVYPYGQLIVVVLVSESEKFCLGLMVKEVIDIFHEPDQIGLCHTHLHLALVDLP